LKRTFDLIFSLFGLLALFPLFIIIAIMIKLDSSGGIIYRSRRTGKNKKIFLIYKFRTMYPHADHISITTGERDPRITRFGYFLRKHKLDELPQLFNILKGDMSFVGPRPDVPYYSEYYTRYMPAYFSIKPGMTSYASIYFADESQIYEGMEDPVKEYVVHTIPKKVELDKAYINNPGIRTDLVIMAKTLKKILAIKHQTI